MLSIDLYTNATASIKLWADQMAVIKGCVTKMRPEEWYLNETKNMKTLIDLHSTSLVQKEFLSGSKNVISQSILIDIHH
jgi:hypothetical protein